MVLAPLVAGLFKWRQFEPKVILLAVGWYLRFSLSRIATLRNLGEEGLRADHVTAWRWLCPGNGTTFASATQTNQR